jgi:hypothetical protein
LMHISSLLDLLVNQMLFVACVRLIGVYTFYPPVEYGFCSFGPSIGPFLT